MHPISSRWLGPIALIAAVTGWLYISPGPSAAVQGGTPSGGQQVPAPSQPLTPAAGNPVAVISTTLGEIVVELFKEKAPVSVQNFLQYARERFYSGTIFHRI